MERDPVRVSDTTAITNLAAIGRLDLLERAVGHVLIPEAVFQELTRHGDHIPGAREARSSSWIEVRRVADRRLVRRLRRTLDRGEAEAIALSVEARAKTLVIDEYAGRRVALALGLSIVGVLGILIQSKRQGLIDSVGTLLDQLRREAGFRVSPAMVQRVLREAGER